MRTHLCTVATVALLVVAAQGARGQCCGDCNGNGTVAINELIAAVNNALGECQASFGGLPASGQTTSYGPGSDGDIRAGAALSYTDNGDGTITDNDTGLMWEKKDDSGGIHDKDNTYTWGDTIPPYTMDGTMVTEFLSALNMPPCFAGHCDWRIPNIKELETIVDYESPLPGPLVSAAFHRAATCTGCADVTAVACSCTASDFYWSSTTYRYTPSIVWLVYFGLGYTGSPTKNNYFKVRAVRGGL